jgi:AcrR family transcriptional regulator
MGKDGKKKVLPSRVYGGISPEERIKQRRNKIILAGLEVFGEVGYRGASVRAICRQADLTDRYFYESFRNTEHLLSEIYIHYTGELTRRILATVQGVRPGSNLEQYIHEGMKTYFDFAQDPVITRVCWLEVLGVSDEVNQVYTKVIFDFANLLTRVVVLAYPGWKLNLDELNAINVSLVGAATEAVKYWHLSGYKAKREDIISGVSRIFLGTLRHMEKELAPGEEEPGDAGQV